MDNLLGELATVLNDYPGTTALIQDTDHVRVQLQILHSEQYDVKLDEFYEDDDEDDEDDLIGDDPMTSDYIRPFVISDHVTLLDAILNFLAESPHREKITGLTVDGDHKGCEAIFNYDGAPTILKVR